MIWGQSFLGRLLGRFKERLVPFGQFLAQFFSHFIFFFLFLGLQALYETMFRNYGILVGQVLVTKSDFYNEQTRNQLFATLQELMALNIIPIINTNDAVSPPPQKDEDEMGILGIKVNSLNYQFSVFFCFFFVT